MNEKMNENINCEDSSIMLKSLVRQQALEVVQARRLSHCFQMVLLQCKISKRQLDFLFYCYSTSILMLLIQRNEVCLMD